MATAGQDALSGSIQSSIPVRTRPVGRNMTQQSYNQMAGHAGPSIDPNDLVSGNYSSSFQNNYASNHNGSSNMFSSGSALVGDDELLDSLGSPAETPSGMHGHGQDFGGMGEMNMGYAQGMYGGAHGMPMEQANGYSNTPDGDPIQSPYVPGFSQYRQHPQGFGNSIQSPISYAGSPLANPEMNSEGGDGYLNAKARARMAQAMQRKSSNTRSPLTPKTAPMANFQIGSQDSAFGAQPIRTSGPHHEKTQSGQWIQTPNSLSSFPGSGFSSPLQPGLQGTQIHDVLLKAGTSMPAKLGGPGGVSSQEAKRKRRRESHNLVERRRRDNINERIQDLSKLVPAHRLEDDKIRKMIANGTPLSPSLTAVQNPAQATSSLAGPGARRAASGTAGNITTGLPIEDKEKGPNKGDILNGAVSWMRDLMWMLHLKIQQQEELMSCIADLGGQVPFELTDDERRMQTELIEAMARNDETAPSISASAFSYTRTSGTGLRVPHHTDYKGEPLNGAAPAGGMGEIISISPDGEANGVGAEDLVDSGEFWGDDDDGSGDMNFKEEDEYMDLGQ